MASTPNPKRLMACMPDGRRFVPGESGTCLGPDSEGKCAAVVAGGRPNCQDAIWVFGNRKFRFQGPLQRCPITLLTGTPPSVGGSAT